MIKLPTDNAPCTKENPYTAATHEFGTAFDQERMTLYGHPIKLAELMRRTNQRRIAAGKEQIAHNPEWVI
jgi:hypothetical protein